MKGKFAIGGKCQERDTFAILLGGERREIGKKYLGGEGNLREILGYGKDKLAQYFFYILSHTQQRSADRLMLNGQSDNNFRKRTNLHLFVGGTNTVKVKGTKQLRFSPTLQIISIILNLEISTC